MSLLNTFNNERVEIIELLDLINIDTNDVTKVNRFINSSDSYSIDNIINQLSTIKLDRLEDFHGSYSCFSVDDILEYYNDIKEKHGNLDISIDCSYGEDYYEFEYDCNTNDIDNDIKEYLFKNSCFCFISQYLRIEQKNNLHIINMTENISIDKLKRILKDD